MTRLILGTRGSALALAQVELTKAALAQAWPDLAVEVKTFTTRGDQKLDLSLIRANEAGGKGLFTKELEDELLSGEIDVAVHSLKDLPGNNPPGLAVTAVLERAPTADVLISKEACTLDTLPQGAVLGTSSVRRARQLQWLRPDLEIEEWRGNVQTRLRKLSEHPRISGIILAQAGLVRLGYDLSGGKLEFEGGQFYVRSLGEQLLPAIGQGVIALQSRADRREVAAVLDRVDHRLTHQAVRAERELQRLLAGDCALPVGVRTEVRTGAIHLQALLFGPTAGTAPFQAEATEAAPEAAAATVFAEINRQQITSQTV